MRQNVINDHLANILVATRTYLTGIKQESIIKIKHQVVVLQLFTFYKNIRVETSEARIMQRPISLNL